MPFERDEDGDDKNVSETVWIFSLVWTFKTLNQIRNKDD